MELQKEPVETARAQIARTKYHATIKTGIHTIIADEPIAIGGGDTGPTPYALLLASLGSCTVITLRMYIDRKMWLVDEITVELAFFKIDSGSLIQRKISFKGELTEQQTKRLLQIADACPVHQVLTGNIDIQSEIV